MFNLNLISEKIANDNDRDQRLKIGDKIGIEKHYYKFEVVLLCENSSCLLFIRLKSFEK